MSILDSFSGSSYPAVKWADVGLGNVVSGVIVDVPEQPVQDKLDPNKYSVPITLELADGEMQILWVGTKTQLGSAIKAAVRAIGPNATLVPGATLKVKWESNEAPKQAGHSPMRVFKAIYEAPVAAGVNVEDVF